MKVVIAIDSFKGSLSSIQAGNAIKDGVKTVFPEAEVYISPIADGGEGTMEAIVGATGGEIVRIPVHNPLAEEIIASYGIIPESKTAVIEMASAAGLPLIPAEQRNPLYTTTYGVGEMIGDAIEKGCRNFIIGLGGSATNDGGVGMLQALGFEFLDNKGDSIVFGAEGLSDLAEIRIENAMPELSECTFHIACDVENPLCGEKGASAVYGPQKGADNDDVEKMDKWLNTYAKLTKEVIPESNPDFPGSGAAGGMGFAFLSYLNSELKSGIELVIGQTNLEEHIKTADVVVTGEGRLDGQSAMGKAPVGVAKIAKKYGKKVVAFAGCVTDEAAECNKHGIDAFFPILRTPCTVERAMECDYAYENLKKTSEQVFRLLK